MQNTCISLQELKQAFLWALALPPETNWDAVEYGSSESWDSMAHLQLVSELERRFSVMLSTDEVIDLSSFSKARQIIEAHGVPFEE